MIEIKEATLFDVLEHKERYDIERVLMTTYSFEKALLLPIAYRLDKDPIEQDSLFSLDELCQLHPQVLRIFYQKNKLLGSKISLKAAPVIERALNIFGVPVEVDEKRCFHPKVILVFYRGRDENAKKGELLCRLGVSSRNLTLGESKEAIVVIEKQLTEEVCRCLLKPDISLANMITFINQNFERVYFQSPDDEKMSIERFMKENKGNYDYLDCISPGFELKEVTGVSVNSWWNETSHAKVYIYSNKNIPGCRIWVGSANCTYNGLHKNYECITYFNVMYSRDEIVGMLRDAGYENSCPNYVQDSDSDVGIDSLQKEMGALHLERQGQRYILRLDKPISTIVQKGQVKLEIVNHSFDLENGKQEYIIDSLQWIPKYAVLGHWILESGKKVMQYRTVEISLSKELENEYAEQLQESCKRNLQTTSVFSKGKSRSGTSAFNGGDVKRKMKTSGKDIMYKDGEFEQMLSLYYELGTEELKTERKRIQKYKERGLFDEKIFSNEDIDTVLQMMEMLIKTGEGR